MHGAIKVPRCRSQHKNKCTNLQLEIHPNARIWVYLSLTVLWLTTSPSHTHTACHPAVYFGYSGGAVNPPKLQSLA